MTPTQAGLKLFKQWPELEQLFKSPEECGMWVFNKYPSLYDNVSAFAREIKAVGEQNFESSRWTEKGRLESTKTFEEIRKAKLENLHAADMIMEATKRRVPVSALAQIAVLDHQYEIEKKKDNDALDVGNRERLTDHELIDELENKLMNLIDRRDKETHELKKKALTLRINRLMEELDGRAEAASVQASHRERVEREEKNPDSEGSSRTEVQKDMEQVPPPTNRIGF